MDKQVALASLYEKGIDPRSLGTESIGGACRALLNASFSDVLSWIRQASHEDVLRCLAQWEVAGMRLRQINNEFVALEFGETLTAMIQSQRAPESQTMSGLSRESGLKLPDLREILAGKELVPSGLLEAAERILGLDQRQANEVAQLAKQQNEAIVATVPIGGDQA